METECLYRYEVGILLDKNNDEFECYNKVYDKKYGYYDEDQSFFKKEDFESTIEYVKNYVTTGVPMTYGIISITDICCSKVEGNLSDCCEFTETDFDANNVVFTIMKNSEGEIIEDFISKPININKFELTDKEREMLIQYASVYKKERDFDITSEPIVVVEKRRAQFVPNYHGEKLAYVIDNEVYYELKDAVDHIYSEISCEGESEADGDNGCLLEKITELLEDEESEVFDIEVEYLEYEYVWDPVAYFLTRKEADLYRQYQAHNLGVSRTYTKNIGYSNYGDLHSLLPMLLRLGQSLLDE